MGKDHFPAAVRYVDIFRLRRPQILIIKIAVLQNFPCLNMDLRACRLLDRKRKDTGDLLP